MSSSYRETSKSQAAARLGRIVASESSDAGPGSAVSENHGIERPPSAAKFKRGGAVEGETVKRRPDRPGKPRAYATGGAVKANRGKTNVNIIIAPQGAAAAPASAPMPVPPPMPAAGPPMSMPPPPPQAGPQIPPEALAALAGQAGGGVPPNMVMRKRGGRVPAMDAGAGSGEGRLEKAAKYGAKQKK